MSTENFKRSLEQLDHLVEKLKNQKDAIYGHMQNNNIELGHSMNKEDMRILLSDPDLVKAYIMMQNGYLSEAHQLVISVDKAIHDYRNYWAIEQAKKDDERLAERRHLWKLWGERLVRWSVGAMLAVVLYSAAVWLADTVPFFKVPIRDWLPWQG